MLTMLLFKQLKQFMKRSPKVCSMSATRALESDLARNSLLPVPAGGLVQQKPVAVAELWRATFGRIPSSSFKFEFMTTFYWMHRSKF
jgi:hypothetical protein